MIYLICNPTLAISGVKLFYFLRCRVFVSVFCCPCHASHVMSSCTLHLRTCSSHAFEHFPRCLFCIPALLCPPVVLSTSFRVWGLNISGLDRDLPRGLGLLPVDRLLSFIPFGLRLMLQRLTEGPKRPRVCCSPTPLQFGPKPSPSSRAFDHDRVAENRTSFGLS